MNIQYHLKTFQDLTQKISEHDGYIKELKDEMKDAERESFPVERMATCRRKDGEESVNSCQC